MSQAGYWRDRAVHQHRHVAAHERAAAVHEQAARMHRDAAEFFDDHDMALEADRERALAAQETQKAEADRREAARDLSEYE
jgi:hypothetical protein